MVIIAAFAIAIALISGFKVIKPEPPTELNLVMAASEQGRLRVAVKPNSEIEAGHFIKQSFDYSCGSAALATLMNYYLGEKLTEKQVIQGLLQNGDSEMIAKRRAFSLLDMKRFVTVLGYQAEGYTAEMEDLQTLGKPALVRISIFGYTHFAVFRGIRGGHVFLTDPWRGDISFTVDEFKEMWFGKEEKNKGKEGGGKNQTGYLFVVSPPAGGRELSALRLKDEDLRYIDEDQARQIIFDPPPKVGNVEQRRILDNPGKYQYYGK